MRSYERNGVVLDPQSAPQPQGHGQQAPSYAQPAYGATGGTGYGSSHDAGQHRSGSSAHGAPSSGSDLGKLASEVLRQVSAARSSSSPSQAQYGGKRKKSFLDQLLG